MNRKSLCSSVGSWLIVGVGIAGIACPDARAAEGASCRAGPDAWPQFRADARRTGDNPAARLAPPLRRTMAARFPAPIYASPAVLGDRVFVQDARGHLACLDRRHNTVVWTAALGGFNNASSPGTAVVGGSTTVGEPGELPPPSSTTGGGSGRLGACLAQ